MDKLLGKILGKKSFHVTAQNTKIQILSLSPNKPICRTQIQHTEELIPHTCAKHCSFSGFYFYRLKSAKALHQSHVKWPAPSSLYCSWKPWDWERRVAYQRLPSEFMAEGGFGLGDFPAHTVGHFTASAFHLKEYSVFLKHTDVCSLLLLYLGLSKAFHFRTIGKNCLQQSNSAMYINWCSPASVPSKIMLCMLFAYSLDSQ